MIASLSIAGIFPLSGFWSKDEIVATTLHHPVFFVMTLLIAFMTAFYMFRLCFLTFFGKPRDQHRYDHAHESPKTMTGPLIFLAVLSVFAGWVAIPWLPHGYSSFVFLKKCITRRRIWRSWGDRLLVGLSGIFLAFLIYYKKVISADAIAERFKPIYTLLYNKCYFDELYDLIIVRPILAFGRFMWTFDARVIDGAVNGTAWLTIVWSDIKQWFDTWIVDGAVNGSGWLVQRGSSLLRYLQTGALQFYALFILGAVLVLGAFKIDLIVMEKQNVDYAFPQVAVAVFLALVVIGWAGRTLSRKNKEQDLETEK